MSLKIVIAICATVIIVVLILAIVVVITLFVERTEQEADKIMRAEVHRMQNQANDMYAMYLELKGTIEKHISGTRELM
ncbi:MAG: hypothetical protein IJO70_00520 [Lachnospiraceae bacterium]|nr:hypothetical protein [Lachnospiraceae bacterium]